MRLPDFKIEQNNNRDDDQATRWRAIQNALICNIKCKCDIGFSISHQLEVQRLDPFPDFLAERVFEWDFDSSSSTRLHLSEADPKLTLYGQRATGTHTVQNGAVSYRLDTLIESRGCKFSLLSVCIDCDLLMRFLTVVGAIENQPICKSELDFEAEETRHILDSFLPLPFKYNSSREFCVNTLYGGSDYGNLGGVCLHNDKGEAELSYPAEFKYPQFTRSFYEEPFSLRLASALQVIEAHCNSNCWCPNEKEKKNLRALTRVSRIDRIGAKIKKYASKMIPFVPKKHSQSSAQAKGNSGARGSGSGTTRSTLLSQPNRDEKSRPFLTRAQI
jgi:hypothetical protein